MMFESNELILNHITNVEYLVRIEKDPMQWADYEQMAFLFLTRQKKHIFEDELLKKMTIEEIRNQKPRQYIQGMNMERNGKMEHTWYNIWGTEEITFADPHFAYFFACKLRHVGLFGIDQILDFHFEYSFRNEKQKFHRFLETLITAFKEELLNQTIIDTIRGWIKINEAETPESQELRQPEKEERIKG